MKLKYLLETFDYDNILHTVAVMCLTAKRHRHDFLSAFELLKDINPSATTQVVRYTIIHDDVMNQDYFGANDQDFKAPWNVILGKEVKRDKGVDLSDEEIAANCLINIIFLGKHPKEFNDTYMSLTRGRRR